jgi:hypothetical protein
MYTSEDLLDAARSIRPFLGELLGPESRDVDDELAEYLARAQQGEKVDNLILELLRKHTQTRVWAEEFLQTKCPPDLVRTYEQPPGSSEPVLADKYRCPEGDYIWHRRNVAIPVPQCPTHRVALQPVK